MGNRVGGMGNRVADLHSLTKFQEILRCSVCFDFMQSPIYQCHAGHALCSSCKARVLNNKCPNCRQQLSNIRCLALEKMAKSGTPRHFLLRNFRERKVGVRFQG
ncbi:hypothetical protein VitviT2T_023697 [Vitis vinifera]|uniref:RING-type domain-containing protein n=2 Tax=Vitis vinifera TaxID=29760 RepID=A0ABY9DEB3_VITVI|eukprot:XP_019074171.1 PREDICTED: E3 ubiquitin-protein ligase SINAT3-like [Vitis vinifera]